MRKLLRFVLFILIFVFVDVIILVAVSYSQYEVSKSLPDSDSAGFYDILLRNHDTTLTQDDYQLYCYNDEEQTNLEKIYASLDSTDYKLQNRLSSAILEMLEHKRDLFAIEYNGEFYNQLEKVVPSVKMIDIFRIGNNYYFNVHVTEGFDDSTGSYISSNAIYKVNDSKTVEEALTLCNGERTREYYGTWMPTWLVDIFYSDWHPVLKSGIIIFLVVEFVGICVLTAAPWKKSKPLPAENRNVDDILKKLK